MTASLAGLKMLIKTHSPGFTCLFGFFSSLGAFFGVSKTWFQLDSRCYHGGGIDHRLQIGVILLTCLSHIAPKPPQTQNQRLQLPRTLRETAFLRISYSPSIPCYTLVHVLWSFVKFNIASHQYKTWYLTVRTVAISMASHRILTYYLCWFGFKRMEHGEYGSLLIKIHCTYGSFS